MSISLLGETSQRVLSLAQSLQINNCTPNVPYQHALYPNYTQTDRQHFWRPTYTSVFQQHLLEGLEDCASALPSPEVGEPGRMMAGEKVRLFSKTTNVRKALTARKMKSCSVVTGTLKRWLGRQSHFYSPYAF